MPFSDQWLEMLTAAYTKKQPPRFPIAASSMGDCPRRQSMLLMGESKGDLSAKGARVLEDGTVRGAALAARLQGIATERKLDVRCEYEVWTPIACHDAAKISIKARAWLKQHAGLDEEQSRLHCPIRAGASNQEILVRGRIDAMLQDRAALGVHLLDFKGKASYGMKMLREGEPVDPGYVTQFWMYILGCRKQGLHVLSMTVFYEDKDKQEWLPIDLACEGEPPAVARRAMLEAGQILDAWAGDRLTGMEGTPLFALDPLVELRAKGKAKLPWQCAYCAIGPERGKCVGSAVLTNKGKEGDVPKWEIS